LLAAALRAIGFDVRQLAARVQWNDESDRINARTHMLLQVQCEGEPYFVDVGFGGIQQTTPLRAVLGLEQPTSHEPFRLEARGDGERELQVRIQDSWRPLYRFDLQEQHLVDYELANYWVSTNPNSRFVKGLLAARVTADCRYALHNNAFATHALHGATERRLITDALDLRVTLESVFQIRLPATPQLDALLERLVRMT
jgi:N-hydroxyarylamine O-acetyltransferase